MTDEESIKWDATIERFSDNLKRMGYTDAQWTDIYAAFHAAHVELAKAPCGVQSVDYERSISFYVEDINGNVIDGVLTNGLAADLASKIEHVLSLIPYKPT